MSQSYSLEEKYDVSLIFSLKYKDVVPLSEMFWHAVILHINTRYLLLCI